MRLLLLALTALLLGACASSRTASDAQGYRAEGLASWYGSQHQGQRTASGERFDASALTAAHRSLPFGTRVKVTHLGNGRTVVVRINDRGPTSRKRIIDLSQAAAERLDIVRQGVARVRLESLD